MTQRRSQSRSRDDRPVNAISSTPGSTKWQTLTLKDRLRRITWSFFHWQVSENLIPTRSLQLPMSELDTELHHHARPRGLGDWRGWGPGQGSSGLDACSHRDGQAGSGCQRAHWQAGDFTASGFRVRVAWAWLGGSGLRVSVSVFAQLPALPVEINSS